ncbi:MAG TPA: histidine--tRNA ligase [Burkholderiaceae bacterium]|nr:histidine--tRNA ligase [Burkholderiaceae bacterium]
MSAKKIAALRGMNDMLPSDAPLWEWFEARIVDWLRSYGYRQVRTPLLETTELFVRGIGEVTDIVEHEMYSFEDRLNGERLTLRPEFTAGIVRAAIEHSLTYESPQRVWSMGPVFRHERPQRGRYRQFHQVDVEALGFAGPDIDAEHIAMLARLWRVLGIERVHLEINCLGQAEERANHRADLIAHFERHVDALDADARRRLHANPLRILDSKNPALAPLIAEAPRITAYLGAESRAHFDGVQALLGAAGIPYVVNPRLVRGLDYYNLTVFEWITDALGAQGTLCGGGRYDPLAQRMGGKPMPACGFGIGIERVVDLLRESGRVDLAPSCDAYVVHQGGATRATAFLAAERLRDAGLEVTLHAGEASLKGQLRRADAHGAAFAVIIGESEAAAGTAAVKALHGEAAARAFPRQEEVSLDRLADVLVEALSADDAERGASPSPDAQADPAALSTD